MWLEKVQLGTYASVIDENGILWFSDATHNALMKCDLECGTIEWGGFFPDVDIWMTDLHLDACIINDSIIFIPTTTPFIHIYSLKTGRFKTIRIPGHEQNGRYVELITGNSEIYFACQGGRIFCLDLKCNEVKVQTEFLKEFELKMNGSFSDSYHLSRYDRGFIAHSKCDDILYVIDIFSWEKKIISLNGSGEGIYTIEGHDGKLVFLYKDRLDVVEYDLENHCAVTYKSDDNVWIGGYRMIPYAKVIWADGKRVVLNQYAKKVSFMDYKKQKLCSLDNPPEAGFDTKDYRTYGPFFSNVIVNEGKVFFVPCRAKEMLIYDLEEQRYSMMEFAIGMERYPQYTNVISELLAHNPVVYEGTSVGNLKSLITYVK